MRTFVETKRGTEITSLRRFEMSEIDLGRGRGGVEIRLGTEALASVSLDEPGRYLVVLYEDAKGVVRSFSFYDPKYGIAG